VAKVPQVVAEAVKVPKVSGMRWSVSNVLQETFLRSTSIWFIYSSPMYLVLEQQVIFAVVHIQIVSQTLGYLFGFCGLLWLMFPVISSQESVDSRIWLPPQLWQ
jgi:hypothetical protein